MPPLLSSAFLWCSFVTLLAQYCYFELTGDPGTGEEVIRALEQQLGPA
jgi:hypothetical protein